jgi:hypothetical protein
MISKNIIYGLVDPNTNEIRYIGKSTSGLSRPREHLKPSAYLKQKNHKANWIKHLVSNNQLPYIVVLQEAETKEELTQLEIKFIAEYRNKGYKLTNGTNGGEGAPGMIHKQESRDKISLRRINYLKTLTEPLKAPNKKEHVFIDGVECKVCFDCKQPKPLGCFSKFKRIWDGLKQICRECSKKRTNEWRKSKPIEKLSQEELKQSYEKRKQSITEALKAKYKTNPEIKDKIAKAKNKAIIAINVITNELIEFSSGLHAKEAGYDNTNISTAIKSGKPYRGYIWKFKS